MRAIAAVLAFSVLSGCSLASEPAIRACEAVIAARLKAPSTYKRVSAVNRGADFEITFDAVNSFNAPIRATSSCSVENGKVVHLTISNSDL
jgi:hypothetical protein